MNHKKIKHEEPHNQSNVKKDERFELSETDIGLEAVEKGTDFAEGDQNNPPHCGGL
ncbi:hypothetical protein [Neobacillus notoginsengisoli]|uniref:hypothetical protein n=1 Tax=Neobacillus notoginsengisoli TaxID=1578198 RepID=UPI0013149198|nr:hypothetical protein [Neobacillus notoginsengisoli]